MVRLQTENYPTLEKRVRKNFEQHSLSTSHIKQLKMARFFNPSLTPLEYHSPEHCVRVTDELTSLLGTSEISFSESEIRHGLLAALYHDAAHPGSDDDATNVAASAQYYLAEATPDADIDPKTVAELIRMTSSTLTPAADSISGLIHDADILQTIIGTPEQRARTQGFLNTELKLHVDDISSFAFVENNVITDAGANRFRELHTAFLLEKE